MIRNIETEIGNNKCGAKNKFGHPIKEVLDRLKEKGMKLKEQIKTEVFLFIDLGG